jgi:hypothetical protein
VMSSFDAAYSLYNEFQRNMERYWCLRWLQQEQVAKEALSPTLMEQLANRLSPQADKSLVISRAAGEGARLPSPQSSPASGRGGEREEQLSTSEPQRGLTVDAVVLRENLVKLARIPLVGRIPSLPETPPGTRIMLEIGEIDLLDLSFNARFISAIEEVAACEP